MKLFKKTRPMIDAAEQFNDPRTFTAGSEGDSLIERLEKYKPTNDYQYEWNQSWDKRTTHFCTAFAPMCAILSYKNKSWDQRTWNYFFDRAAKEFGYERGKGNHCLTGVKTAVKFWNLNHPEDPLIYFDLKWNSPEFHKALELGYRISIGGGFNNYYGLDKIIDKIINKVKSWINKKRKYGHAFTIVKHDKDNYRFIDNYKGSEYQSYLIGKNTLEEARYNIKSHVGFYPQAYVIVSGKDIRNKKLPFDRMMLLKSLMAFRSNAWEVFMNDEDLNEKKKHMITEQLHQENNRYRKRFGL